MIQDIHPHVYNNAYRPRPPREGDRVFFYQGNSTLFSKATGQPFTFEEAAPLCGPEGIEGFTYLFSIDEVGFFWAPLPAGGLNGREEAVTDAVFRTYQPDWLAFAGITAHQLRHYYATTMLPIYGLAFVVQQCGHISIDTTINNYANATAGLTEITMPA